MQFSDIKELVLKLENNDIYVEDIKDYDVNILKAIGWQFALRYKHIKNKESELAQIYLSTLIDVRTLVKSKLNVTDIIMQRYKND